MRCSTTRSPSVSPTSRRTLASGDGGRGASPDHSFLGVPIVSNSEVIGAFYLTDKVGAAEFTDDDQAGIVLLASHAAAAIEAAGCSRTRGTLAMSEERSAFRPRELHDALNQSLFSLTLTAKAASRHLATDPDRAAQELDRDRLALEAGDGRVAGGG